MVILRGTVCLVSATRATIPSFSPVVITLLGMPGSGKSTQSARLRREGALSIHLEKIDGELMLDRQPGGELMPVGGAEPDPRAIIDAVLGAVRREMPATVVLDSFPRTEAQAEALVIECRARGWLLVAVELDLDAEGSLLRQRERSMVTSTPSDEALYLRKIARATKKDMRAIAALDRLGVVVIKVDASRDADEVEYSVSAAIRRGTHV